MLTHKIAPFKTALISNTFPLAHQHTFPHSPPNRNGSYTYFALDSKIGFARYLHEVDMDVGDFVIPKNSIFPFKDHHFFKVDTVQELHYLLHWDKKRQLPQCLRLESSTGMFSWGVPEDYFKSSAKPSPMWGVKPEAKD